MQWVQGDRDHPASGGGGVAASAGGSVCVCPHTLPPRDVGESVIPGLSPISALSLHSQPGGGSQVLDSLNSFICNLLTNLKIV